MKKLLLLVFPLIGFSSAWGEISIQNDQQFFGDDDTLHIVGEIQNNFNAPINQLEILATLYSGGIVVDTIKTPPMLNTIMPDMKNPFEILVSKNIATKIDEYSLKVNYEITEPKSQVIDITESDFTRDNFDNLMITGTVANKGEITANTLVVVATLYDKNGNVAAVSKTHVEPDYLRANDESFFFVPIPDKIQSNSIVDYSLVAESEEYTAVPEFPLGSMLLLTTSLSAYVILTRYSSKVIANLVSATNLK
ncbi:MAG TPA: FxLYD domain-containing protein [Nitrosopumilaceae archaeon]|nr:FxLYD domain-containing protein [Nitrosopumilaceae archaeon]